MNGPRLLRLNTPPGKGKACVLTTHRPYTTFADLVERICERVLWRA